MMDYMREGGIGMWLMLVTALATGGYAAAQKGERRAFPLAVGSALVVIEGILGLSTGMLAVSRNAGRFPDKAQAIAEGLGELANNGTLAVALSLTLGLWAVLARESASKAGV